MSKNFSKFGKFKFSMKKPSKGHTNITAHIITWAVIYLFPILMTYLVSGGMIPTAAYTAYGANVTAWLIMFYLNYCLFVDRYLFKSKFFKFVLYNFLAILLTSSMSHLTTAFASMPQDVKLDVQKVMDIAPIKISILIGGFMSKIVIILMTISLKATNRMYLEAEKRQLAEKEKTEAELKNLKNKLNPHFLFNALNNIYALTAFDSEKAQAAIDSLSKLLRYVLYENESDMVPLEGELEFTRCYIDLMSLRLDPSRSTLETAIEEAPTGNYQVATLMFMTLIENAFKHGISSRDKSYIKISIKAEDRDSVKWIICTVSNSFFPKTENDKSGSGIGLDNLRQRLDILYKDEHKYEITTTETDYTSVIEIPLRQISKQQ